MNSWWSGVPVRKRLLSFSACTLVLFWASLSQAHHAVQGRYDYDARMTLTGRITRVDWINPHVRIYLDVTETDGSVTTWELLSAPAQYMRRRGISKSRLIDNGGEPVEVLGIRARNLKLNHRWAYRINFADGHFYELSTRRPGN